MKTCNACADGLPPCGPAGPTSKPTQVPTPGPTPTPGPEPETSPEPTLAPTLAPTTEPKPTTVSPTPPPNPGTGDWQTGTATFYGDGGSGGHCGGNELWPSGYGTGSGWIDGLYVATASWMWCGQGTACGNKHSSDCGHCYEVMCTGTDTNTEGYTPCTGKKVTVAVTDECPGGPPHCNGPQNHFDLSTKAYKIIGDEKAGAIHIKWRRVDCPVPQGTNVRLVILGDQWWFKIAAKDAAGPGAVAKMEVKSADQNWKVLDHDYGAFFKRTSNIGGGPYEFRLTADDGQTLSYTIPDSGLQAGTYDIGSNFV